MSVTDGNGSKRKAVNAHRRKLRRVVDSKRLHDIITSASIMAQQARSYRKKLGCEM